MNPIMTQSTGYLKKIEDSLLSHSDCCGARVARGKNEAFFCTHCHTLCCEDEWND